MSDSGKLVVDEEIVVAAVRVEGVVVLVVQASQQASKVNSELLLARGRNGTLLARISEAATARYIGSCGHHHR